MALSNLWTQTQINATVRRELMDPTGTLAWSWSDIELNLYIEQWQDLLQQRFEFVWGSSTNVIGSNTSTLTLTNIASNMLRPGNMWWNDFRLGARDKEEIDMQVRDWRAALPGVPQNVTQDDVNTVVLFPTPAATGTLITEYPAAVTFGTITTTPMSIPAWTKYSAVNYCAMRAYMRPGPQQDLNKSQRYKNKFIKQGVRIRTIWEQHFPEKAPSLRIGGRYEGDILTLGQHNTLFQTWF